jgi:hypothetical protein
MADGVTAYQRNDGQLLWFPSIGITTRVIQELLNREWLEEHAGGLLRRLDAEDMYMRVSAEGVQALEVLSDIEKGECPIAPYDTFFLNGGPITVACRSLIVYGQFLAKHIQLAEWGEYEELALVLRCTFARLVTRHARDLWPKFVRYIPAWLAAPFSGSHGNGAVLYVRPMQYQVVDAADDAADDTADDTADDGMEKN